MGVQATRRRPGSRYAIERGRHGAGEMGQPLEELWHYDGNRDDRDTTIYQPPPVAIEPANCHRASLRQLRTERTTIRAELMCDRPVIVAVRMWERLRQADTEPLPAPEPAELMPAGHAVAIVGHDPQQSAVLVRNSWGRRWGNDGHLWVSDDLIPQLLAAWVVEDSPVEHPAASASDPLLTEGN